MARAATVPGLSADTPLSDAAAAIVEVRTRELFKFARGVLDTSDIERVHDMRVASRRLRAALEVFAPCFPKTEHKRALRDVKRLADALGARRDPDVALEALHELAAKLPAPDRPGLEGFEQRLRAQQDGGNVAVEAALRDIQTQGLQERLEALAAKARTA
jgi:CHAD domain-containing protein